VQAQLSLGEAMPLKGSGRLVFLFVIILALVAGGYALFIWFIINVMQGGAPFGLLFVALVAGVASFFNPCSFPVLPAYLAQYYTTEEPGGNESKKRLLLSGVVAALGVTTFNILLGSLIGILGIAFGQSLGLVGEEPSSPVRWLRGIVGGLLLILGFSHATGRGIDLHSLEHFFQRIRLDKIQNPFARIFSYGFGYTLLGIGCGGPILAGLSVFALSQGGFSQALLAFLVYSLVMASLMVLISILVAFSKETLLKDLGQSVLIIKKTSGALLLIVGLFLIISSIFVTAFTKILFP
jgi:cytochrome c-type biogenesis protein